MPSDSRRENQSRVEQEPSRFPIAAGAFAAALAGVVYLNALDNPFVYDDYWTVVHNPTIRQLFDLRTIVSGAITRPVVNLSYAIDRAVWGEAPFGFHVTNVLLHIINTLLLSSTDPRPMQVRASLWCRVASAAIRPSVAAFIAAILFAVHPISTEAVGYISGRSELLCAGVRARRRCYPRGTGF